MKTYKDMLLALRENKDLRAKASTLKNDDLAAIVAFGKAHGYEFTEEDIHFQHAANRVLDDREMELVSGGIGRCESLSRCMYNVDCRGNAYSECFFDDYCSNNASGYCFFGDKERCRMGADQE